MEGFRNAPSLLGVAGGGGAPPPLPHLSALSRAVLLCALCRRPLTHHSLSVAGSRACVRSAPVREKIGQRAGAMNELEARSMHVFIARSLKKVLKEAPKKQVALRQACAAVIGAPPCAAARARAYPTSPP